MNRIIPQITQRSSEKVPQWLNAQKIVEAAHNAVTSVLQKVSSKPSDDIITQYACMPCNKRYFADNEAIVKQATKAKLCPKCGSQMSIFHTRAAATTKASPRFAALEARAADLQKGDVNRTTGSGTYNTYVDRHMIYRMTTALQNYANKMGMLMPTVTFIRSEHTKMAGQEYPMLNGMKCKLEWMYAPKLTTRAYASIAVDEAGNYVFPRMFQVASGKEISFEKKAIQQYEASLFELKEKSLPAQKKTDIPTHRRPDISRFRATASLEKEADAEQTVGRGNDTYHTDRPGRPEDFGIADSGGKVPNSAQELCDMLNNNEITGEEASAQYPELFSSIVPEGSDEAMQSPDQQDTIMSSDPAKDDLEDATIHAHDMPKQSPEEGSSSSSSSNNSFNDQDLVASLVKG